MTQFPAILSAVAASMAAVLSSATLYLSGRRDHRRWLREALIEAYVDFLGASFATGGPKARSLSTDDTDPEALARTKNDSDEAHRLQTERLTRLRLIARPGSSARQKSYTPPTTAWPKQRSTPPPQARNRIGRHCGCARKRAADTSSTRHENRSGSPLELPSTSTEIEYPSGEPLVGGTRCDVRARSGAYVNGGRFRKPQLTSTTGSTGPSNPPRLSSATSGRRCGQRDASQICE
ncbi:hypothetical protein [Nocardia sp. alder85J]|uniref:hypothetical protein n=1 Tax=Nocardia sp. alder85J TaxID=2862949 RepID=UPI001CD52283|nr:hypothetical protein [Nocardia sp. alder85J]MCX4093612.1 hypothetical protein [Nocardia sp. alder85J]